MVVERYSHIMHLTSQVSGRLAPGKGPIDVLRATLPAGTLSGAPKVRAMEIIDELEPTKRGVYGGVVGYLDFSGNLDTAIAIRTMTVAPDGRGLGAGRRRHRGRQRPGGGERRVRRQGRGHAVGGGHGPRRPVGTGAAMSAADRVGQVPGGLRRPPDDGRRPRAGPRRALGRPAPTPPPTSRASAARTWPASAVGDCGRGAAAEPAGQDRRLSSG